MREGNHGSRGNESEDVSREFGTRAQGLNDAVSETSVSQVVESDPTARMAFGIPLHSMDVSLQLRRS